MIPPLRSRHHNTHHEQTSKSSLLAKNANQHLARTVLCAIIASFSSIAHGHGLLVKPASKNAGDASTSSTATETTYFAQSAFGIIDKAFFDGDHRETPWMRPGKFDHEMARDLISGYPQTLHPCGCNAGTLGYCAGLGEAAGFGETTLGPLPGIPHPVIPPEWAMGSHQEVGWNAFANHGGGYLYMLCKKTDYDDCRDAHLPSGPSQADQEQTDAYLRCVWDCFESMTLEWVPDTQKVQYQDDACTYASTKALTKFGKNGHSWRYTPIPDYLQVTLGGEGICTWEHVTGFSNTKAEAEFIESFGTSDVCDTGPHAHNPKEWQIMD